MLRRDTRYLDEIHICPHCQHQMACCEAPPIHVGDGLGWGAEVLFICLNDECTVFTEGWENIANSYGHYASYRYMELPDSHEGNFMMVGSSEAFKGSIVDPQLIKMKDERYQQEKLALEELDQCVANHTLAPILTLLLDEAAEINGRKKAAALLVPLNNLDCIDPLRNHHFRDTSLEMQCNMAISTILTTNLKKECPFCGGIVKMQAKKCLHCQEFLK